MKKDDLTLKDQVSVHLAFFGGFQIPCKEYFALAGNVVMSTICEVLLLVTVVALIVRWARMRKNLLEPFEEPTLHCSGLSLRFSFGKQSIVLWHIGFVSGIYFIPFIQDYTYSPRK